MSEIRTRTTENWLWISVGLNSSWLSGWRSQDKLNAEGSAFKQQIECGKCYANKILRMLSLLNAMALLCQNRTFAKTLAMTTTRNIGTLLIVTGRAFRFHSRIDGLYCFRTALFEGLIRQSLRTVMHRLHNGITFAACMQQARQPGEMLTTSHRFSRNSIEHNWTFFSDQVRVSGFQQRCNYVQLLLLLLLVLISLLSALSCQWAQDAAEPGHEVMPERIPE